MLRSKFPMFVLWGADRTFIYNDAYIPVLGNKHPDAFGKGFFEVWPEVREEIGPIIDRTFAGEASFFENLAVNIHRNGGVERAYFTFSYSPILGAAGRTAGVLCTCIETTKTVLAEQRQTFLLDLEQRLRGLVDPLQVIAAAEEALGKHLATNRVGYGSVDETGRYFTTPRNWTDGTVAHRAGTHDLQAFGAEIMGAIQRGESLVVHDVTADPRINTADRLAAFAFIETAAAVTVSLVKQGRLRAAMYVHQRTPRRWAEEEVELIRDVAERTWSALERAQAESKLREETVALEVLNRTGSAIAAELDLDRIVQVVTDAGVELTGAQFGAFFYNVPDDAGGSYMLYALSGAPREAFSSFPHPRATPVFRPTFHGEGVVRSDDILQDPRYGRNPPHRGMPENHLPVRSYLAVPVISRSGEVLGGLFFGHEETGIFSERAERLATGLAAQAAIAVDNARLFQSAQREIRQRIEIEKHHQLLINELNHRVKNTLATVQSIAAQSLRHAGSTEQARLALEGRLLALSRAHDVLTQENWDAAGLHEIVAQAVGPFQGIGRERISFAGPAVRLAPQSALAIAMALQELATNATKYGALSNDAGAVGIRWRIDESVAVRRLHLCWEETGGPTVRPPERRGFGTRLIERSLAQDVHGSAKIEFFPSGIVCTIEAVIT